MKTVLYAFAVVAPTLMSCGGDAASSGLKDASTEEGSTEDASTGDASTEDVVDAPSIPFDAGAADADATHDEGSNDGDADAGPLDCVSGDGGSLVDAAYRFNGSCSGGCPLGTLCAVETGGVAGGGGEYCAPIPNRCRSTPTCACLGSCACGTSFGWPENCSDQRDQDGGQTIWCDNGIR